MLGPGARGPPEHSAIGNIRIFHYWVLLHYMSFKTIAGGFNGAF